MGLSLAVFGCRKPKKCTKSKDKKNPRYPALRSSALSTELILPGSVSLSLGVAHLLYWACSRLSGLSGMEIKQRSKDEKRMIREKKPGYFCQICQIVIFYRRRILSVRIYWKRMALFELDSQVLTVYILGTWQAAMLVDETIYDFFFRGIWMKKSLVLSGGKRYLFVSTYVAAVMSAEDLQWSCDHCSTNACTT